MRRSPAQPGNDVTGPELRAIRTALGLSIEGFARLMCVHSGRVVRRWEMDEREIAGPVRVLARALMDSRPVRQHFGVVIAGDPPAVAGTAPEAAEP